MTSHPCESLFLSEAFSDVTFIVENQCIPAHKMLLAANCPYFETMLFGATNESKMSSIHLNNVSYKTFVEVLRCVYLRKVDISEWTPDEVKTLIKIADEYQFLVMLKVVAETLNIDNQITFEIIEDIVAVAKRLDCKRLMETCVEAARKWIGLLGLKQEAFDKLPMDLIIQLIDNKVWNPADARLVYWIGNWRKTVSSFEDRKVLLSRIDWKSLPGKYSEPLVRMFLGNDVDGLQVNDWTKGLKQSSYFPHVIASVYTSNTGQFYNMENFLGFLKHYPIVLTGERRQECVVYFFREVISITKVQLTYIGKATITLRLHGDGEEREIIGRRIGNHWEFNLLVSGSFSSAALQVEDPKLTFNNNLSFHDIYDLTFCCD